MDLPCIERVERETVDTHSLSLEKYERPPLISGGTTSWTMRTRPVLLLLIIGTNRVPVAAHAWGDRIRNKRFRCNTKKKKAQGAWRWSPLLWLWFFLYVKQKHTKNLILTRRFLLDDYYIIMKSMCDSVRTTDTSAQKLPRAVVFFHPITSQAGCGSHKAKTSKISTFSNFFPRISQVKSYHRFFPYQLICQSLIDAFLLPT